MEATVGDRADVQCEATGSEPIYYTWERIDGQLQHDTDAYDANGLLRFRTIRPHHQGEYRCTARNQYGDDEQLLRVYVSDGQPPPTQRPPYQPPTAVATVEIDPPSVSGRPGDELRLQCRTQPGGSVSWSKAGGGHLPSHVYIAHDTLIIEQARREDAGEYVCTVTVSGQRPVTGQAYVHIEDRVPPTQRPPHQPHSAAPQLQDLEQSYTVIQGQDLSVVCVLTAGNTRVVWSKVHEDMDANVQQHGNTLRIAKALVENRGVYMCKAESDQGTSQVSTVIEVERKCCEKSVQSAG